MANIKFDNLKDLETYCRDLGKGKISGNIGTDKKILTSLKGKGITSVNREQMREASEIAKEILCDWVDSYFNDYTPKRYKRTGKFKKFIQNHVFTEKDSLKGIVYFGSDGAIRNSFVHKDQPQGYLPTLLNYGWKVKKNIWFKNYYHAGYYRGFGFLEAALADAKRDPRLKNINIELIPGNPFA